MPHHLPYPLHKMVARRVHARDSARLIAIALLYATVIPCVSGGDEASMIGSPLSESRTQTVASDEIACPYTAEPPPVLYLREVLERSVCRSPAYQKAWATVRSRAAEVGVSRSALLPSLIATLRDDGFDRATSTSTFSFYNTEQKFSQPLADINLQVPIYDFGEGLAKLRQARALLISADADRADSLLKVVLAATKSYYTLESAQEELDATVDADEAAKRTVEIVSSRMRFGAASAGDQLSAQVSALQADSQVDDARLRLSQAKGELASTIGVSPEAVGNLAGERDMAHIDRQQCDDDAPYSKLLALAMLENPSIKSARAQLTAAEQGVRAAVADGLPSISLIGEYQWLNQRYRGSNTFAFGAVPGDNIYHSLDVGIEIHVPIIDGGKRSNQIYEARASELERRADVAESERDVGVALWKDQAGMRSACCDKPGSLQQWIATSSMALDAARTRYKNGVADILDVLEAQRGLVAARRAQIDNLSACHTSAAALSADLGALGY
jgi:outer membrane protein